MVPSPTTKRLSPLLSATILADSIGAAGVRLLTYELVYPRFIHAEVMTHRVFSRNASSSRAIPFERMISMILADPAVPASWRMDQPGMQGYEVATDAVAQQAEGIWLNAMLSAIAHSRQMGALGIHKQTVNRLTEPFAHIKTVMTGVYWENWDGLRDHVMADPTIQPLAALIKEAKEASTPTLLTPGEWHLPYVTDAEKAAYSAIDCQRMSTARCARVSYNNHDGSAADVKKDFKLHDMLVVSQPLHASPAEHQATPDERYATGDWANRHRHGNLAGWIQYRKTLDHENLDLVL